MVHGGLDQPGLPVKTIVGLPKPPNHWFMDMVRMRGWVVPANGPVLANFEEGRNKGLTIGGKAGDPVVAAADGRVVYAGSGLRGYGNLVIVKHSADFLTAYAHNQTLLVKEDQVVKRGQKIAEMGSTDAERVQLHFEIRKKGKPLEAALVIGGPPALTYLAGSRIPYGVEEYQVAGALIGEPLDERPHLVVANDAVLRCQQQQHGHVHVLRREGQIAVEPDAFDEKTGSRQLQTP